MAAEVEAYALAAVSQAPEPFRRMLETAYGYRPGIAQAGDWAVTQNGTPNMTVNVAAGRGLVDGSESSSQGMYFCQSLTTTNLAIATANATNPRRDLVVARIKDNEYATGPTSAFSLEVITGTAAASPSDPTVPANCLVVARVAVAALASTIVNANITDLRSSSTGQQRLTALGGVQVCTSTTRPTVGLSEGAVAYETDTDRVITYNGSAWIMQPFSVSAYDAAAAQIGNAGYSAPTIYGSPGPAVSLLTGSKVLVTVGANMTTDVTSGMARIGVVVSGASTVAAADDKCVLYQSYASGSFGQVSNTFQITGLTPGVNTFTAVYKGQIVVTVATFLYRTISVCTAL